jgi:hypothetical protein
VVAVQGEETVAADSVVVEEEEEVPLARIFLRKATVHVKEEGPPRREAHAARCALCTLTRAIFEPRACEDKSSCGKNRILFFLTLLHDCICQCGGEGHFARDCPLGGPGAPMQGTSACIFVLHASMV